MDGRAFAASKSLIKIEYIYASIIVLIKRIQNEYREQFRHVPE